ncbi:MAG: caspase family protein [Thermosynechococcaceae cyanobacterium]
MLSTRRDFLQRIGALGVGLWLGGLPLAHRYSQVLAQSTPRKLALLVGVNQYSRWSPAIALQGCVTDVELHHELLVHRFGFQDQDIQMLTNEAATRSNIEAVFMSHLADQARPGDIVVFHFSGYGCLIRTRTTVEGGGPQFDDQQVLIPYDGWVPNPVAKGQPLFNGIYEDTLFLLLRSLLTDQVTTVLDAGLQPVQDLQCHSIRERALPQREFSEFSAAELAFQARLLQQTQLTRDQAQVQRQAEQVPGLVLSAATTAQPTALEIDCPEFSAGLFSSALIRQLWASPPSASIPVQFSHLASQMVQRIGPSPQPSVKGQKSFGALAWNTDQRELLPSVGAVISTDRRGQTAKLWLGGLPEALLALYQPQSCLRAMTLSAEGPDSEEPRPVLSPAKPPLLLQLQSRRGRTAIAQVLDPQPPGTGRSLQPGLFLQEAIRVIPRSLKLQLALGSNLDRIERVDATSVLSMAKRNIQVVGADRPADYVLAKIPAPLSTEGRTETADVAPKQTLKPLANASYGLAYLGGVLLPNTLGDRGEVVERAIQRLLPTLETLLALKWLELSQNNQATALFATVTLETIDDPPQPLIRLQTDGSPPLLPADPLTEPLIPKVDKTGKILTIPNGTAIQYRMSNHSDVPIYALVVGFNGGTTAFASYETDGSNLSPARTLVLKPSMIQPGASMVLPATAQTWKASPVAGVTRTFIILTRQPLTQWLAAQTMVQKVALPNAIAGFAPLAKPLPTIQKLLADLHQASLPATTALGITPKNTWVLDTTQWISLQLTYHTV